MVKLVVGVPLPSSAFPHLDADIFRDAIQFTAGETEFPPGEHWVRTTPSQPQSALFGHSSMCHLVSAPELNSSYTHHQP